MKCPYPECRKDYNDKWSPVYKGYLSPESFRHSQAERQFINRLNITTWQCHFCQQYFHSVSVGKEVYGKDTLGHMRSISDDLESLVIYPVSKTKFEAKSVPGKVRDAFNEAERCRSVGSITGTGASLRKAIYALCDEKKAEGANYREKIANLPVKDEGHKELLKQFKWLGDNVTKPGEEAYTVEMIDAALEILPVVIDGMYLQKEKEDETAKLLAKARSANSS